MILKRNLLLLIYFFSTATMAQEAFQSGYIISSQKDTLKGYVAYKNAKTFKYKKGKDSQTMEYKAQDVLTVVSNSSSQVYESHYLSIETAPLKLSLLKDHDKNAKATKMDTVFVKALVLGKVSLYQLTEDTGREHFYLKKEETGNLEELVLRKYYKDSDGKKTVTILEKYKGQLTYQLRDCNKLDKMIQKLDYSSTDLQELIVEYLKCTGASQVQTANIEKPKLQFGLVLGASNTNISFKSDNDKNLESINFPSSINPVGGVSFNLKFPKKNWRSSIYNEILYKSFSTEGDYSDASPRGFTTNGEISIDFAYIRLNSMLRYNYATASSLKPFFNFGFSNSFAFKTNNTEKTQLILGVGNITEEEKDAFSSIRKYEQGLLLGGGAYSGKLSGEVRFEMSNGISNFSGLSSPVRSLYLIIGYHF